MIGKAVVKVLEKIKMDGRDVYHIISRVKTNKIVSLFSKIDDRVESYLDAEELYSRRTQIDKRRQKGKEEKRVDFNQVEHRAIQMKDNTQKIFDIPPKVQDFLSSLYFLRTQSALEVGWSTFVDIHQNEKNWRLEVQVLKRERVSTPDGTYDAIKVQVVTPGEGLFKNQGETFIWFTDDSKRIPVMMKSKGKKGLITAALSAQKEGENAEAMLRRGLIRSCGLIRCEMAKKDLQNIINRPIFPTTASGWAIFDQR